MLSIRDALIGDGGPNWRVQIRICSTTIELNSFFKTINDQGKTCTFHDDTHMRYTGYTNNLQECQEFDAHKEIPIGSVETVVVE